MCSFSLSLVFIAFPFDFTMERACYRIVVTQWPLSRKDRTKIKVVVENIKKEGLLKKRVAKLALVSRSVVDKWQDRIIPFSY